MTEDSIIKTQLEHYKKGKAGCMFAAHAAGNPSKFEWQFSTSNVDENEIADLVNNSISDKFTSTKSIIFPSVVTWEHLKMLLLLLPKISLIKLGQEIVFESSVCLGYRMIIGEFESWITGFGPFAFFPKTRQSPYTEIVFRVKPRPSYDEILKEAPVGVIHLADMDMKGMDRKKFKSLWNVSFANTESILGAKPDLRSAAKTTFTVPATLWSGV